MSVAALKDEAERELVVAALTSTRGLTRWDRWDAVKQTFTEQLPPGTPLRLSWSVLPEWYRQLWYDPTQFDSRAVVTSADSAVVAVRGVSPSGHAEGVSFSLGTTEFLQALLDGQIGDAS
jgi:hypothetical protein